MTTFPIYPIFLFLHDSACFISIIALLFSCLYKFFSVGFYYFITSFFLPKFDRFGYLISRLHLHAGLGGWHIITKSLHGGSVSRKLTPEEPPSVGPMFIILISQMSVYCWIFGFREFNKNFVQSVWTEWHLLRTQFTEFNQFIASIQYFNNSHWNMVSIVWSRDLLNSTWWIYIFELRPVPTICVDEHSRLIQTLILSSFVFRAVDKGILTSWGHITVVYLRIPTFIGNVNTPYMYLFAYDHCSVCSYDTHANASYVTYANASVTVPIGRDNRWKVVINYIRSVSKSNAFYNCLWLAGRFFPH